MYTYAVRIIPADLAAYRTQNGVCVRVVVGGLSRLVVVQEWSDWLCLHIIILHLRFAFLYLSRMNTDS